MYEKRIAELRQQIQYHSDLYYNQDTTEITDAQFDSMMNELRTLEAKDGISDASSPTKVVGGTASGKNNVEHVVPMLSLRDVFDESEVRQFVNDVKTKYPDVYFVIEQKIDGLSLSLEYQDGKLVRASTRGNGHVGEDVTKNAMQLQGVPMELSYNPDDPYPSHFELRGEVYMSSADFEKTNEKQEAADQPLFKNARNCAAGTLRQSNPALIAERGLSVFIFNVQSGNRFASHFHDMEFLKRIGFPVIPTAFMTNTVEGVLEAIQTIGKGREPGALPYGIDGAVIKVAQYELREKLGAGAKYPAWAIAFKYPAEQKETVVTDITLQVGRTGRITPVAELTPTQIAGTCVSRATLHNQAQMNRLGLNIGDTVILQKAGDIIPEIVEVVKKSDPNRGAYQMGTVCPVCGSKAEFDEGASDLRCVNPMCPAQISRGFAFFASKPCMDIDGMGDAVVDALISNGYLHNYADIYYLYQHRDQLIESGIIGKEKSVDNLLRAIENSKSQDISRLIKAIGVRNVGGHAGKALAKKYDSMQEIMKLTHEDLAELSDIPDIGSVVAQAIINLTTSVPIRNVVQRLADAGVNMSAVDTVKGNALTGKKFVITGTLPSMKRPEAAALIEAHGGTVSSSVSKNTDYLLAGEAAGSKLDKAKELNVKIISESELMQMIQS